jgi:acetoacetyl-CoA synthetase
MASQENLSGVENRTSTSEERLATIWRRVLPRSPSQSEDNFFELGGDPWLAIELFNEIERVFGRTLPPLLIYTAPTIASLAALLEDPAPPSFPPCVKLKAGTEGAPAFLTHGLGGNILEFFELVRCIRSPRAIYGLQARGMDGIEEPFSSIEEMAQYYLDAIRTIQTHGPYILIGYSLGGLVTFEMARRLSLAGESIALLSMIDSYPDLRFVPIGQRLRADYRTARNHISNLTQMPFLVALSYSLHASRRMEHSLRMQSKADGGRPPLGVAFTPAMERVREFAEVALRRYKPRCYHGTVKFVRAARSLHFPDDPAEIWTNLVDAFDVQSVPGDHHQILTTQYESLAAVVSRYLDELPTSD